MYASNSMEDILLKLHLDAMAAGYYGKFKVQPMRSQPGPCNDTLSSLKLCRCTFVVTHGTVLSYREHMSTQHCPRHTCSDKAVPVRR